MMKFLTLVMQYFHGESKSIGYFSSKTLTTSLLIFQLLTSTQINCSKEIRVRERFLEWLYFQEFHDQIYIRALSWLSGEYIGRAKIWLHFHSLKYRLMANRVHPILWGKKRLSPHACHE